MSAVTDALDAEIVALQEDINQNPDPRQKRLEHLRSVRMLYLNDTQFQVIAATPEPLKDEMVLFKEKVDTLGHTFRNILVTTRATGRKPSPERVRATAAAHDFLLDKPWPVKTAVIYDHVTSLGINVPGEVPVNNLSAMLSNDPRFRSEGRSGWVLVNKEAAA